MLILIFFLVFLVVILFFMLWESQQNLRDTELSKRYLKESVDIWKGLHDEQRCEILVLQRRLKKMTPEIPQAPWWAEED